MRSQIEPASALSNLPAKLGFCPIRFFRVCSWFSFFSRLLDRYLSRSFCLTHSLCSASCLFPRIYTIPNRYLLELSPCYELSIFDPSMGRALSRGSIFSPVSPYGHPMGRREEIGSRTRSLKREKRRNWRRLEWYLRPADKFTPSREKRDTGMHLYRARVPVKIRRCRCRGAAREKLPIDVSAKNSLPTPKCKSLCLKFSRVTDETPLSRAHTQTSFWNLVY